VGFASAEVFTRAFKAHFGVTPGAWRRGAWRHRAEQNAQTLSKIHQAVRKIHQDQVPQFGDDASIRPERRTTLMKGLPMQVELRTLPAMQLAYMRHTGPYGHPGIGQTWARFAPWAGAQGLLRPGRALLGISQDDPMVTPPEKCRYDCCVEVDADFRANGEVGVQAFEGGRYACTRFTGTGADIHAAWMRMFAEWLPGSGWQPADRPALELYEPDFVVDKATGAFTCLLCVPVRAAQA
jgi:AraC family transcriptional regulator